MKIAFLLDWHLYYTVQLANALVENHNVLFITRDHNYEISSPSRPIKLDDFLDECLDKNIIREKLRYRQRSLKSFHELNRIHGILSNFHPDIIHVQENSDWRYFWLAKAGGFDKTVLTIHDVVRHPGDSSGRRIRSLPSRLIRQLLEKRARRIIVHGDSLKKQLISIYKKMEGKVSVVPHGALAIFKTWDNEKVNEEKNTILFFGRISKYKGIEVLIKAQQLITKEIPEARIIIAGGGRDKDFSGYESLMEEKNHFEIHYGFIPNAEVQYFFRRASVVVLPYIEASQSGVIPIAYVFGKPVVVTNVGSIPEVVDHGKTGFIVPPNSPEALAKALVEILRNRDLRESMSKNALAKAATDLSWATIAQKTIDIYSLIQSHG